MVQGVHNRRLLYMYIGNTFGEPSKECRTVLFTAVQDWNPFFKKKLLDSSKSVSLRDVCSKPPIPRGWLLEGRKAVLTVVCMSSFSNCSSPSWCCFSSRSLVIAVRLFCNCCSSWCSLSSSS